MLQASTALHSNDDGEDIQKQQAKIQCKQRFVGHPAGGVYPDRVSDRKQQERRNGLRQLCAAGHSDPPGNQQPGRRPAQSAGLCGIPFCVVAQAAPAMKVRTWRIVLELVLSWADLVAVVGIEHPD